MMLPAHGFCSATLLEIHSLPLSPSLTFATARQAVKNTPKRLPSITVRSPLGASPPTIDSQTDSSVPTPPMETGGVTSDDTTTHSVVRRILPIRTEYLVRLDFLD